MRPHIPCFYLKRKGLYVAKPGYKSELTNAQRYGRRFDNEDEAKAVWKPGDIIKEFCRF